MLTAEDGVKGPAIVRLHKPDLVVSDVQMTEMSCINKGAPTACGAKAYASLRTTKEEQQESNI